jgi:Domain of unknown function (DUF1707)
MRGYGFPPWNSGYPAPGSVPNGQIRVSDAERNEVAELLSQHFTDGRLDHAEFDERTDKAMHAKTRQDLAVLLVDLPPLHQGPALPVYRPRHRVRKVPVIAAAILFCMALGSLSGPHQGWAYVVWPAFLVAFAIFLVVRAVSRAPRRTRTAPGRPGERSRGGSPGSWGPR